MRSYVHWAACLSVTVTLALTAVSSSAAQTTGTVRGRVVEVGSRRPVSDAQVTISGTAVTGVSNAEGDYVLTLVPAGAREITVRRIGYAPRSQSVAIPVNAEVRADFELNQTAAQLEQVVVTGTAGVQTKREIGNAVTQLDVAAITSKATVTNVSEVLQGRTPGVTISAGSGSPGTSSEITIRGYGSFTNNRPVVYIDGVRMDTEDLGSFNPSGAGTGGFSGQRTSALDLINPQDIESIEVIRGPAAATLYGADAAGGVIQIITKKGTRGQQDLRWTARWENGWNEWGVETLTNYTTCTPARKAAVDGAGNPLWTGCQGRGDNEIITDNPMIRDPGALQDGGVNNLSLSLRGGGDRYSFYISGDGLRNVGVLENNYDKRRSIRTNFTFNPTTEANFNINVGYIRQDLRLPLGDEAFNGLLLSAARGIPGRTRPRESLNGWGSIEPSLAHRYNNSTISDRLLLGTTINFTPFEWWSNRLTAGMDWRSTTAQVLSLPGDPDVPAGLNALRAPESHNYSLDYAGSLGARLTSDLFATTSFGAQATSRRDETIAATGSQLPTREITIIGAALSVSGSNTYSEFNTIGGFLQQQLAWRDRIYGTFAIRMDDHSSFGENYDPIIYPKASLSWVLSEEPALARYLDVLAVNSFRFRGAWGLAGRAPAPYAATQTYGSTRVALGTTAVGGALTASSFGNPDLRPEKGEEIELGFDSDYLGGRAGLEFTYYTKTMRDLLVPIALPPSLGFSGSVTQNFGKTRNSGVEMGITGTPVDLPNFVWDGRINMSWNRNKLLMLDTIRVCRTWVTPDCPAGKSAAEEIPGGASYSPGMQRNRVGYPLGSYFVRYPTRDENGNYVINQSTSGALTTPVYETEFKYLGPAVPTRLFSLSNTFTFFKNFQLFGMLDYQGGHYLFNYKEYHRCALVSDGPNCARLNQPGLAGTARLDTLRAVYGISGTPTIVTSPMTQTQYVEKADYVKLRDLSLTYNLPVSIARRARMSSASIVLSGRNLALWSGYSGLDPEVNGYSNNQLRGSGNAAQFVRVDAYSWPMIRRYTFQLNATY